jgi:hypothetical protein
VSPKPENIGARSSSPNGESKESTQLTPYSGRFYGQVLANQYFAATMSISTAINYKRISILAKNALKKIVGGPGTEAAAGII